MNFFSKLSTQVKITLGIIGVLIVILGSVLIFSSSSYKKIYYHKVIKDNENIYQVSHFLTLRNMFSASQFKEIFNRYKTTDQSGIFAGSVANDMDVYVDFYLAGKSLEDQIKQGKADWAVEDQEQTVNQMFLQMIAENVKTLLQKNILDSIQIKEEDVKDIAKTVQVRHILLSKDGLGKDNAKVDKITKEVMDTVKTSEDFSKLAKKYSEDPSSKQKGGLLDMNITQTTTELVPEFKNAAIEAKKAGEIIPNVQTEYGTHILYIESITNRTLQKIKKDKDAVDKIKQKKYPEALSKKMKDIEKQYKDKISFDLEQAFKNYQNQTKKAAIIAIDYNDSLFNKGELALDTSFFPQGINNQELFKEVVDQAKDLLLGYIFVAKDASWKNIKKDFIKKMVLGNIYITHMVKEKKIAVSDQEAKEFYDQQIKNMQSGQFPSYDDKIKNKIKASLLEQKQQNYVMSDLLPGIKKDFKDSKEITLYDFKDLKEMEKKDIEKQEKMQKEEEKKEKQKDKDKKEDK